MTPEAIIALVALAVALCGSVLAWNRADASSKARNDIVAERVGKLEQLGERVTKLEGRVDASDDKHDDLRGLLRDMRAEILARFDKLEAERS